MPSIERNINCRPWSILALLLTVGVLGCGKKAETPPPFATDPAMHTGDEKIVSSVISSEDLILDLSRQIDSIGKLLQKDGEAPNHFAGLDRVVGLGADAANPSFHTDEKKPDFVQVAKIGITEVSKGSSPWATLEKLGAQWSTLKFGVIKATFADEKRTRFLLDTKVEARGSDTGTLYGLKGHQQLVFGWRNSTWQLVEWIQKDLKLLKSTKPMFQEVLADSIADKEVLKAATRSYKDEILLDWSRNGRLRLPRQDVESWVQVGSNHIFPSVSVVDYNNDGHDDMFLTARWGPTQMLKNNGDGTFEDDAREIGLRERYMVNCVLFADLDNDGDKDAFMGRPMEKAKYLRNDDGKFVDITESHSDLGDQYFVSSVTVTDVNRDGLLDVYLTCYAPLKNKKQRFEDIFLSKEERSLFARKHTNADIWVNTTGTSNVLLMNRGEGNLERVPYDELLSQWRRSFQGVWADVDNDGDDDLYVCTDFAPNALLRNDTPRGAAQPVFTNADDLIVDGPQGFSMGGSWGDFDSDGDLDLYVSNMFSKAGRRILAQVGADDPRLHASSAGNFLFKNQDGKFTQEAGESDEGKQSVDKVGWSWGGQWADFDNDGDLDLYVPSGFHTAPEEIAGVDI